MALLHPFSSPAEQPVLAVVWPACNLEVHECRQELSLGTIEYHYDMDGRLTSLTAPHSRPMTYEYRDGHLDTITHGKHKQQLRYEGTRIVEETGDNGTVRWTYDAAGRIATQVTTIGARASTTTFSYAPDGQLRSHRSDTATWTYSYDANGRVSRITSDDWTHVYTYRPDGHPDHFELIDKSGAFSSRIEYSYDAQGRLVEERTVSAPDKRVDRIRHVYDCDSAK
jgi:YD repeat-containing protein